MSINLPYNLAWNTVAMSGLVLLVAAWICWIQSWIVDVKIEFVRCDLVMTFGI